MIRNVFKTLFMEKLTIYVTTCSNLEDGSNCNFCEKSSMDFVKRWIDEWIYNFNELNPHNKIEASYDNYWEHYEFTFIFPFDENHPVELPWNAPCDNEIELMHEAHMRTITGCCADWCEDPIETKN